jgi:hypothetical protein
VAGLFAVVLAGAAGAPSPGGQDPGAAAPGVVANGITPVQPPGNATSRPGAAFGRWGFDGSGIDRALNPGDSFFDYANGAWAARTAIPADKTRFGMFDALTDRTQEQVRAIVMQAARSGAAPDTDDGKIGALQRVHG